MSQNHPVASRDAWPQEQWVTRLKGGGTMTWIGVGEVLGPQVKSCPRVCGKIVVQPDRLLKPLKGSSSTLRRKIGTPLVKRGDEKGDVGSKTT